MLRSGGAQMSALENQPLVLLRWNCLYHHYSWKILFVYLPLGSSCIFPKIRDAIPQLLKICGCYLMLFAITVTQKRIMPLLAFSPSHSATVDNNISTGDWSDWENGQSNHQYYSGTCLEKTASWSAWFSSHVPHQLLIPTQGTRQDCPSQRQCQLRAFLQLQTDGCSPFLWNSSLVSNIYPAFSSLSCWVTWLNCTSPACLSEEANWPLWSVQLCSRGNKILQNISISNVLYEISLLSVLKLQEEKKCAKVSFKLLRKQLKQQPHHKISYFYYNKDAL